MIELLWQRATVLFSEGRKMKKKINIPFSLFVFTALIFVSCNSKKSIDTISGKTEIAETISTSDAIKEENENIEKTKPRPRIRELDWYVGKWKEFVKEDDGWFEENPTPKIELEIKKENDKYFIIMNEKEKILEGELFIDKYFLPKNITDEEIAKYDSRDYIVADFSTSRYWIGIQYAEEDYDTISLNLDDIDICVCRRESE